MPKKAPQSKVAEIMPSIDNDTWVADESAGPTLTGRLFAEFLGTFILLFMGIGVSVFVVLLGGRGDTLLTGGLAWGLTYMALIIVIGRVSGAHFNPAITIGAWVAGRFPGRDVALYIVAQVVGAIGAGALIVYLAGTTTQIGENSHEVMAFLSVGYGEHSPSLVALLPAMIVEFLVTGLLVAVVLAATSRRTSRAQAPFAIGFAFSMLVIIAGPLTNAGLNPARATATAIFASVTDATTGTTDHWALGQLWQWWIVMLVAGAFVGLLYRGFGPVEDLTNDDVESAIES